MTAIKRLHEVSIEDAAPAPIKTAAADGPAPAWVETPTSKKIYQAILHAQTTPTLVLIYGAPGVSKTTTAARYVEERDPRWHERGAYHINLLGVKSSASMLQTIHAVIRTPRYIDAYRNVTLMRSLANCLEPGSLLILDEAQSLRPDALDAVRFFLDERDVGLVLMGNEIVYGAIASKSARAHFAQLSSRIGLKLHLPHPTEADADAVLKAWGVTDDAGREYGRKIALGPGGLRQLAQLLRHARTAAAATRRSLDHRLMHAAASALGLIE
ncbi:MAG: AAA family ATPase [Betaproteobacteria bacterium]|nr:AAA family ATPase [Betaproteobacteria bacterium]